MVIVVESTKCSKLYIYINYIYVYYANFIPTVHLHLNLQIWIVILPIDCKFWCDARNKPVCRRDWKTYSNECVMWRETCKRKEAIIKLYNGRCKGNTFAIQKGKSSFCDDYLDTFTVKFAGDFLWQWKDFGNLLATF